MKPVHVFNMEVKDNHDEATLGAFLICELCQMVSIFIESGFQCIHEEGKKIIE